jgi:predicted ester cyclase
VTPQQMDRLVDDHLSAEARGDIPAVLDTLDEGIVRNVPGGTDMLTGKDASRAFYSALFAELEITGYRNLRRWHGPDFLVDLMLVEAKATGNPFGFDGRGRSFEFSLLHVFEFANGRISLESGWPDMAAIAAQLGD